jgi:hypothetical protein
MSFVAQNLQLISSVNSQLINKDRLKNAKASINILLIIFFRGERGGVISVLS